AEPYWAGRAATSRRAFQREPAAGTGTGPQNGPAPRRLRRSTRAELVPSELCCLLEKVNHVPTSRGGPKLIPGQLADFPDACVAGRLGHCVVAVGHGRAPVGVAGRGNVPLGRRTAESVR